jgi:hypothetical protein
MKAMTASHSTSFKTFSNPKRALLIEGSPSFEREARPANSDGGRGTEFHGSDNYAVARSALEG